MPQSQHRWRASPAIQTRARELRREMTPTENRLWEHICGGQIEGAHFRRQHPVAPYILDFFCARSRLVIEIDGELHDGQVELDLERTRWLNEQKHYRVIRFTNDEVIHHIGAVLEEIRRALLD